MESIEIIGMPVSIFKFSDNNEVTINTEPLKTMLEHPDVKNRKIVPVSIIGAFRKGKSFFLDYCLRFLYANFKSINFPDNPRSNPTDWMGSADAPLAGFSWRSGSDRDTTGIIVWNDVFLYEVPSTGEKLAIIVMDTQGLFDNKTSPGDNSRIFVLGTLISSIQILNLNGVVQEDQLQYLQFATEFAKFSMKDSHGKAGKPFQNLVFLIRDWQNPDDYPYGIIGGKNYMEKVLNAASDQKEEIKSVRKFIKNSFEDLSCSLLPHPGKVVATGRNPKADKPFDGSWDVMDEEFKDELKAIIEYIFSSKYLIQKKINDESLSSMKYLEYVDEYFLLFQSDEMPQAQSIYESTVEKQMNLLIADCCDRYKELLFKNKELIKVTEHIPVFHKLCMQEALKMFKVTKKMGTDGHHKKFKNILIGKIDQIYEHFKSQSEESVKLIEIERQKTQHEIEEKERLYQEQIQAVKDATEKALELERLKGQMKYDDEKCALQKEIADLRLATEKKRLEEMEKEKENDGFFTYILKGALGVINSTAMFIAKSIDSILPSIK